MILFIGQIFTFKYFFKSDLYHIPKEYFDYDAWLAADYDIVQEEMPEKPLEELRKEKLAALNSAFASVESGAWVMSSLGFKADANTTANTNIEGLIKSMSALGQETVIFCDYDNVYREVTLEGLQTLQLEVIRNGQSLYAQKWAFRNAINAAQTKEELDAVVVEFVMMDFSV